MALIDNLIAYYKLDSNANDSSANWNNGTPTAITYSTGKIWNGAVFTLANNSRIQLPSNLWWSTNAAFSCSMRVKPNSPSNSCYFFFLWNSSDYTQFNLNYTSGTLYYGKQKAYVGWIPAYWITLSTTQLTHIVVTINASVAKLYINGVYVATGTNSWNGNTDNPSVWSIGDYIDLTTKRFQWIIDEVAFHNRQITDWWISIWSVALWEVAELYNWWLWLTYPFTTTPAFIPNNIFF